MLKGMKGFQHVTITVSDIGRSLAFYRDLLGFPYTGRLTYREKGLVIDFLDAGSGTILELFSSTGPTRPGDWMPDDMQCGLRHVGLRARGTDAAAARLKAAGVTFTLEPFVGTGGSRIAFFKDPDGTLLEVVEAPPKYHAPGPAAPAPLAAVPEGRFVLDHVTTTVSNLDAALRHYRDLLGFPQVGQVFKRDERGFTMTFLQAGSVVLELFSFAKPTLPRRWDPDESVLGLKHVGFLVDDVHAGAAELKAAGVKFIYQPALARGKVVTSFFEDPDGNALELIDGVPTCDA